ncbi:MAG TPA: SPOR domain-containing protein [Bacteroidales bacterium]|nr:SPOR domain-containing protein [Bacteroidales bacterium]
MKKYISLIGFLLCVAVIFAQRPAVIQNIERNSKVIVKQDPKLDKLINDYIEKIDESGPYTGPGYRVQVFSSNAQRTAKDEAYTIERRLRSAFPEHGVYRIYASPFWKVRIGDFRTIEDARAFRAELVKLFPEYSRETYTVRENKITIR